MPRIGRHPLKATKFSDSQVGHEIITVTTIVFIPMLTGYWAESLDVLKMFFQSLYQNTTQPFDLMVFDNGSCLEVQDYLVGLKRDGKIQYLVFCQQNLRKLGALNYLLTTAPGDIIAYADSDVYFLPGWLDESIRVLSTFPEAGKVTSLPIVMDSNSSDFGKIFHEASVLADNDPTIELKVGTFVSEKFVMAHRVSLGESEEDYSKRINNRKDVLLKRGSCEVLLSGADFQFTATKKAIQAILPLRVERPEEIGDSIYSPVLEIRLASKGFWQLSTMGYYVHHMGNRVPNLSSELPWLNINMNQSDHTILRPFHGKKGLFKKFFERFAKIGFVRQVLKNIYLVSYRLLYD